MDIAASLGVWIKHEVMYQLIIAHIHKGVKGHQKISLGAVWHPNSTRYTFPDLFSDAPITDEYLYNLINADKHQTKIIQAQYNSGVLVRGYYFPLGSCKKA